MPVKTAEDDVLQQMNAVLNQTISAQSSPERFGAVMYSAGFIPQHTLEDIKTTGGISNYDKVSKILSAVKDHIISGSPQRVTQKFDEFVLLLRNELQLDVLSQQLQERLLVVCRSERSTRSPPARDTPTVASEHLVGMTASPEATNGAVVPTSSPNEADSVPAHDIKRDAEDLEQKFADIADQTSHIIMDTGISVGDFKTRLMNLQVRNKKLHLEFLAGIWPKIANATTVEIILCELQIYWDFLNYTLLEHLINKFGDQSLRTAMEGYKIKLKDFRSKTSLRDFAWYFKDVNKYLGDSEIMKKLEVKFAENWEERTLEDLNNWCRSIAHKLLVENYFITLIKSGCVSVTWAIPAMFAASLKNMEMMDLTDFCKENGITSMSIDGEEFVCPRSPDMECPAHLESTDHFKEDDCIIETSETKRFCQPSQVHDVFQVYYTADKERNDYHGKWMVFKHYDQIDDMWRLIRTAIAEDKLQGCLLAKCSTIRYDPTKEGPGPSTKSVICVYTEEHNIDVIGFKLVEIAKQVIKYKTNIATQSGKFSFTGRDETSIKTIFWNDGRPLFKPIGTPFYGTSYKTEDIWYLNVVEAPEPFISRKVHGRWILYLEYEELTELWHLLKDLVESEDKNYGVIKMVCPSKRDRKSSEEKPEFLVYTSREDHELVGRKLIEHVKRDIDYECKPPKNHDTGTKESLLWNDGKPGYN